jgi:hypothetical protein
MEILRSWYKKMSVLKANVYLYLSLRFPQRILCVYLLLRSLLRDISLCLCLCYVTVLKDSPMWSLPPLPVACVRSRPRWSLYCSAVALTSGWPNVSYLTLRRSHPLIYAAFIFNCLVGGRVLEYFEHMASSPYLTSLINLS